MADPFVGEIRMFAGSFAPRGWALCDGQLQSISSNEALFSLLGTIYGGDGRTTFGLPDLRGRLPMNYGSGPGLTPRSIGQKAGAETVTIVNNTMASHTHTWKATGAAATVTAPGNAALATPNSSAFGGATNLVALNAGSVLPNGGGGQAHNNVQPFLCVNFIIALTGIYPSRT